MLDEITGHITLNRADTFLLRFVYTDEADAPLSMRPADLKFHVGSEAQYLFSLSPTFDPQDPPAVYFTFTPEHARLLAKKEWGWIIRDEPNVEVLAEGATISATGFAVGGAQ